MARMTHQRWEEQRLSRVKKSGVTITARSLTNPESADKLPIELSSGHHMLGRILDQTMRILFLHGWTSRPGGLKPSYLAQHGHQVLNPALPDDDFDEAVRIAQAEFDEHQPDVVVGSSRGGAVAMKVDAGDVPLVLLCPAWKGWGSATTVKAGTTILHSPVDDIVPFADSQELIRNSGLAPSALHVVGTDHRLADAESLHAMLEAAQRAGQ